MTPFLAESLLTSGAVGFMLGDTIAVDVVDGCQGYTAGFPRGTVTAVAGSDTRINGVRYTSSGILRLVDATAGLPAGAVIQGGVAVSSTGQLCYSTNAPSGTSVFVGGMAVASTGAVHISDLSPAAWFRFNQGITVVTGVSQWSDQSGNARHLLQATGANQPAKQTDGSILFDGTNDSLKCSGFTLNQPETTYVLFKMVAWAVSARIFDGNADDSGELFMPATSSPELKVYAGTTSAANTNLAVGSYGIASVVFNGASGVFQINRTTALTGDYGAVNMSGFTLGSNASGINPGNIQVKEVAVFAAAHSASQRAAMQAYLARVGGLSI